MAIQRVAEDTVINSIAGIAQESQIADFDPLVNSFMKKSGLSQVAEQVGMNMVEMMQTAVAANRAARMIPFYPFLFRAFAKADFRTTEWKMAREVAKAPDIGVSKIPIKELPAGDPRFTENKDVVIDAALRALVQDQELSRGWMREIDDITSSKSQALLAEIDRRRASGESRVKIPRLIIGDGPLASTAAIQLGAMNKVGILTEQPRLAEKWRSRFFTLTPPLTKRILKVPHYLFRGLVLLGCRPLRTGTLCAPKTCCLSQP